MRNSGCSRRSRPLGLFEQHADRRGDVAGGDRSGQTDRAADSRFFLPLSYTAILGGMCTTIGTSTNLLINSKIVDQGGEPLGFFRPGWVGLPATLLGLAYILSASRSCCPTVARRSAPMTILGSTRWR